MVSIQVGEISDISMVSDDKNEPDRLLISSGKFSFSHLWGVRVFLTGIYQIFCMSCYCYLVNIHKNVYALYVDSFVLTTECKKITDETMYWTYQRTMDISIFSTYHVKQTIIASPTQMLFYERLMNSDIIILLCRFIHFRTINKTFSISIITSAEVLNNSSNFLQSWNVDNNMMLPQCMQYVLLY